MEDRQVHGRALADVRRVHVAAEIARPEAAPRLLAGRRDRHPAEHRPQRHLDPLARRAGHVEDPDHPRAIDPPDEPAAGSGSFSIRVRLSPATPLMPFGTTLEIATSRFGVSFRMRTTSVSPGAAPSMWKGPTSPGHGPGDLGIVVVARPRERLGLDGVAGLDRQDRRPHRERGHAGDRLELVSFGGNGNGAGENRVDDSSSEKRMSDDAPIGPIANQDPAPNDRRRRSEALAARGGGAHASGRGWGPAIK